MSKLKQKLLIFLVALFTALLCVSVAFICSEEKQFVQAATGDTIKDGVFTYTQLSDGTYSVIGNSDIISGTLNIPSEYNGIPVTRVGKGNIGFRDCTLLTEIIIPDCITTIGERAFANCSKVNSITIGKGIKLINKYAFSGCSSVENVYYTGDLEGWCEIELYDSPLYYNKSNLYINDELLIDVVFPENLFNIGSYTFYGVGSLKNITIHDNVQSIGTNAFAYCKNLSEINIPKAVTQIENQAFYSTGLISIIIPNGNEVINSQLLGDCQNLESVILPSTITTINSSAFMSCPKLKSITLPNSVVLIETSAFDSNLETIYYEGTSQQWEAITKNPYSISTETLIICLGDYVIEFDSSVEDYAETQNNVSFSYSGYEVKGYYSRSQSGYPTSSEVEFASDTQFSEEGYYRVEVRNDYADPIVTYFKIDRTAPTGTLNNVTNGGYTNKNVTFTWTESGVKATLNGNAYTSGQTISAERAHTIVLTDLAGNSATYTFTIDKTAPTGTLSGITNGIYANRDVTFTWTDAGATATLNGGSYVSGQTISAEGAYTIVLTDRAGNSTIYTFTIDKTAPTGTLNNVTDGGYTNKNVTFIWTEADATATLNGGSYTAGQAVSAEGEYTIVLTDLAGNSTTYTFTIDKTAPTGTLNGVQAGGYTNTDVTFTWTESSATATLNGKAYKSGQIISAEGRCTIELKDLAGNCTTYLFTIDKTAPEITMTVAHGEHTSSDVTVSFSDALTNVTALYGRTEASGYPNATTGFSSGQKFTAEGNYTVKVTDAAGNITQKNFTIDKTAPVIDAFNAYTNVAFTMTAQDKYSLIGAWEYRQNYGEIKREQSQTLTLGGTAEANGTWQIRVIDEIGNTSGWVSVNFVYRETFGNSLTIYNSFFVPSYYVVTLSQKNYTNCFGSYTFSDYSSALKFAVSKEWECRVIELDGGKAWNYVNPTNENTRQIYSDRLELDEVIDKYARKNIGERKVIGKNGAVLNNPTDANGITRADALTSQLTVLPGLLSEYSGLPYMLALSSFALTLPQTVVEGNRITATVQFISDGISLRLGPEMSLEYGIKLSDYANEQGWYLITERDVCGNVEKYLIYVDLEQPELYASVTYGNSSKELIYFNQDFIDGNMQTMRYTEFSVSSLVDNMDGYAMLAIEGRNAGLTYVWGDELPVLSFENGYYGAYTITAYDRSRNVLEFTIYIAGEAPSLRYTSLTNETACTFTIQINDSFNEITDIKFFKIHFGGEEEQIYADSYDTPVNVQSLVYRMNVGGKFVFEFTDLYGRTVRTTPVFYMKGLPSATLRGVKDGGLTKNDVSVIYDNDATCELYTFVDGEWIITDLYEKAQGISTTTISITAGKETTAIYKVLLYKTEDRNLFTEYTFEIDGIPPAVSILTESGEGIISETVTTQNFYLTWQESGYKAYYKKQGAISDMQYTKGTVITATGNYVFTVYDSARNEIIFTVTLDNTVSYNLEGTFTILEDGSYITKNSFVFTVNEPYSEFIVQSTNGMTVVNGQKLDTDGTYVIKVKDMYGNTVTLALIVDKLPPEPVIVSESGTLLSDGARVRENFSLRCDETNVAIALARGTDAFSVYDGSLVTEPGTYTFRLSDRVGNVATVTVTIDRELQYRVDGTYIELDGAYCSRTWLLIVPTETLAVFEVQTNDGTNIDNTKRITEEGIYSVTLIDIAGNEVKRTIVIDKSAPEVTVILESGKPSFDKEKINEAFTLQCAEEGATITYSFNGSANIVYNGELLTEQGMYTYTATDKLGNSGTGVIVIDREVQYRIDGSYTVDDGKYYSRTWMLITPSEEMQVFVIAASDGSFLDTDKRITAEGEYTVTITDVAGNTVNLTVVIDKTPPTVKVVTESGKELAGGSVNEAFKVVSANADDKIEYANGNGAFTAYDGKFIKEAGLYNFRITDLIGNVSEISVFVNYDVLYSVEGNYVFQNGKYYSKSWLLVVPQEDISEFVIEDKNDEIISGDKRITAEGEYTVTMTDVAGNTVTFVLVIDKTAPELKIETESGKLLKAGDTTNERFKVTCGEPSSKLAYSFNGSSKLVYTDEWISAQGKYIFSVTDFLGNVAEIGIAIDTSVSLIVSGTYVMAEDGAYVSGSWFSVSEDEPMRTVYILADDGTVMDANSRITIEGVYSVYAEDVYGNKLELTLIIDKTPPEINLDGVEANGATNANVKVSLFEYSEAYYRFNGGDKIVLSADSLFDAEGEYVITARDIAGNTSTVAFTVDKHVDFEPSIVLVDGCIITGSVSFKFNEEVSAKLYLGEEEINYTRGEISKPGEYRLNVKDACGNGSSLSWRILPAKAQSYSFFVEADVNVAVELNGVLIPAPFEGDTLRLTENGCYSIRFDSASGSWVLGLEVDNIPPEVLFENTRTSVKIFSPNKEGLTYTLYRNGAKTSFNLNNVAELTQTGEYRLVCEDELGNVTEYVFTLNYLSDISIILITIICFLALVGIITLIVLRFAKKKF